MAWTGTEIEAIAVTHFAGDGAARCPRCANHLYVKEQKDPGHATVDLVLICQPCGEESLWTNPCAAGDRWSADEIRDIVDAWRAEGEARCQLDRTRLTLQQSIAYAGDSNELVAHCRRCGRFFRAALGAEAVAFDR